MSRIREWVVLASCVTALLWIGTVASSATAAQCGGGQAVNGGGPLGGDSLACIGPCMTAQGPGVCTKLSGQAYDPNDNTIFTYKFQNNQWTRNPVPIPAGSTIAACECVFTDPITGEQTFYPGNLNCCHIIEILMAGGNTVVAKRGSCAEWPHPGRCTITGPANNGEAECVTN